MSPYGNVDVERPLLTPARLALGGPFPNPGRGAVQARLELPVASTVDAWIADVTGRRVTTLVSGGIWSQGVHELRWDGRDGSGAMVRAGVYTLHVRAGDGTAVRSIVRLR
jgi:flagellar hook assembly protein FlgD